MVKPTVGKALSVWVCYLDTMSLEDLAGGDAELTEEMMTLSVSDLVDEYGKEAVRRGLEYMNSLSEADENFKESVTEDNLEEGYREAGIKGDLDPVTSHWAEQSKQEGLGLDDS